MKAKVVLLYYWLPTIIAIVLTIGRSDGARYKIIVTTGDESRPGVTDGPGTDADIVIKLYGTDVETGQPGYNTEQMRLSGSIFRNHFESGNTDKFRKVIDAEDLTKLTKMEIKRNNAGFGPDWLLNKVVVKTQNSEIYKFNADTWLTEPELFYRVPVSSVGAKYKFDVKTGTQSRPGNLDGPGTDAAISVILHGVLRTTDQPDKTNPIQLTGPLTGNKFESGQSDTFIDLKDAIDVINLNKIEVKRTGFGIGPDWLLEKMTVTTSDGKSYNFIANLWLTEQDTYYPITVSSADTTPAGTTPAGTTPAGTTPAGTTPAGTTPAGATPAQGQAVTYDIIVYTGFADDAGSSANIYITLFGNGQSNEIHLRSPSGQDIFTSSSSKVFQVQIPNDLQKLTKISMRQDGSGESPNWEVNKVIIVVGNKMVYEFIIIDWLNPGEPLVKTLTTEYPATSIKFNQYEPCVHPLRSKIHPDPGTAVVLENGCSTLSAFFRFMPDGVIVHLASGMCVQRDSIGDPKNIVSGANLILNPQCTLYSAGSTTAHALQFQFTTSGSLKEINSGKCVTTTSGQTSRALTLSDSCDTNNNYIAFIDINTKIIYPTTPTPGSPPTGHSPPGSPPASPGSPPVGHSPPGSPPVGHSPPGSPPVGHSPPGSPPVGHSPPGSPPVGHSPPGSPPASPGSPPASPGSPPASPGSPPASPGSPPASPGSPPASPGSPPASPSTPGTPPATPGTPPATPGTPPATPGTPPATPGTPPATPGTPPATPGTPPATPGTPPATPGTPPATPGTPPATPGTPPATPGTPPATPGTPPATPGTPPATPGTPPATPGTPPATPGTPPATPGTPPATPGTPPATPGTPPATPGTPPATPGTPPATPGTPPATPGTPPATPGTPPATPGTPPATPGTPPATPGTPPATPGTPPATPGTPPATPGTPPATPGTPPSTPGTPPSTPGTPPSTPGTPPATPGTPPATPGTPPATPGTPPSTPGTPPATPGTPPATPGTPGQPTEDNTVDPSHPELGGNNSRISTNNPLPNSCAPGCSSICQPSCTPFCCGIYQQPVGPSYPQPASCPSYCTSTHCRSTCPIACCSPKIGSDDYGKWRKFNKVHPPKEQDWD